MSHDSAFLIKKALKFSFLFLFFGCLKYVSICAKKNLFIFLKLNFI